MRHPEIEPSDKVSNSTIRIGTSGWMYDGWRGPFYPQALAKRAWLAFYAERFATVEINSAFYRTPSLEAVRSWRDGTPQHFCLAWKASKFVSHWKRLSENCENSDQVSGAIKMRAEADRLVAIAPWRDVGACALLGGEGSDPVSIIATVGE